MIVDDLVKSPGSWLSMGKDTGIVISSRVRLARNIHGKAFPGWAGEVECVELCRQLKELLGGISSVSDPVFFDMGNLDAVDKAVLKERHLISPEMEEKGRGSGLIVAEQERIAVMINEEDHLRLQAISPGMDLPAVWQKIDAVDSEIENLVEYAFSPEIGYLTACPSNVGTGLRASVMVHLPGLRLLDEVGLVMKGLTRLGLAVRGLLGEGTDAYGNMFQISNQVTLGDSEDRIIQRMISIVGEVVRHEQNARERLVESRWTQLLDHVGRSLGTLLHARLLSSNEAMDLLSGLRLGVELGIARNLPVPRINEIMLLTQPGHLQKLINKVSSPEERDEIRADLVRQKIKAVTLQF